MKIPYVALENLDDRQFAKREKCPITMYEQVVSLHMQ